MIHSLIFGPGLLHVQVRTCDPNPQVRWSSVAALEVTLRTARYYFFSDVCKVGCSVESQRRSRLYTIHSGLVFCARRQQRSFGALRMAEGDAMKVAVEEANKLKEQAAAQRDGEDTLNEGPSTREIHRYPGTTMS